MTNDVCKSKMAVRIATTNMKIIKTSLFNSLKMYYLSTRRFCHTRNMSGYRVTWGKAPPPPPGQNAPPPYLTTNLRMPVGPSHD